MVGTAAVAGAAIVTFAAIGVPPKITGPVGTSSASPRASVGPSVAPSEALVPSSLDGQDYAFWTLYRPPPCCGSLLRISTSTGSSDRAFDVPDFVASSEFWPMPAGPAGGRVVFVVDDGRTAHLMVEDARTGADTELTSTNLLIARLAIDSSGSIAYYLLFDRRTSAFQGVWAISTIGGQPRPLVSVQATTATATLAATRVYVDPQLAVSDDGSWIAYVICHTIDCEFHAIHSDGTAQPLDWSNFHAGDEIVGIAGDLLIGSSECPQPTCDGFALDLRTGERLPLGGASAPFAPKGLIAGPHGPLVLAESKDYDRGLWRVDALDLTDGSRSSIFGATFQPGAEVRLADEVLGHPAGAELPPGWFLIQRFSDPEALDLPPDYSAAMAGAAMETKLLFMKSSQP